MYFEFCDHMEDKKVIAIYFSDADEMGYPFHKIEYFELYKDLCLKIQKSGINVFIVRGDSYLGNGKFKFGWYFEDGNLLFSGKEVYADLIFNRDDKNTIPYIEDCKIINKPEFDSICVDKLRTFEQFKEFSPNTAYINSYLECLNVILDWKMESEEIVVLKKNFETEGRGIFIGKVSEISETFYNDWNNILVQEFLDSSVGIPGITNTLHDLRVTIVNGAPINSFLRIPKSGSYLANISQGGSGCSIDLVDLPKEIIDLVRKIDVKISNFYPCLYAADFVNTKNGFKLIELNSRPGLQHPSWSKSYKLFNDAVIDMLIESAR